MQTINKITIEKLVHGGQGLGDLPDGRKCFVWGALPKEEVSVRIIKNKKLWAEAVCEKIIKASPERVEPKEPDIYLATSPWQILGFEFEAKHKQAILSEAFERENLNLKWQDFYQAGKVYGYRNKMEYHFWWDNQRQVVSLALFVRNSHQKTPVKGSALAESQINSSGRKLIDYINLNKIQARQLKSLIIRATASGQVGLSLFVVDKSVAEKFKDFKLDDYSFEVLYSNPKSPASIASEVLLQNGASVLKDTLGDKVFIYSTRSFFQNNLKIYQMAISDIKKYLKDDKSYVIDLFSGVGSIGLSVAKDSQPLILLESEDETFAKAEINALQKPGTIVIKAAAEKQLDLITGKEIVIVDPPRVGLAKALVERLKEVMPPQIFYLSCNPSTQVRDIKELMPFGYKPIFARGYNFFPRTPHIESLVILKKA